ncbi:MAG TPA: hypothetical protein VLF61_00420 [Rhabdochlamydiaceae bacterium]|nr:hypothetical protein [Rhabdochlamydiaceae bacterium]
MKEFPTVISFFTKDTPYEKEILRLVESCKNFGVTSQVEGVGSFGSWELNCAFKPFFILKKLEELKKPLLWIDADGAFVNFPRWEKAFEGDFSVRIHENLVKEHPSKVISSTIFVRPTSAARQLVRLWAMECQKQLLDAGRTGEFWDQVALRDALFSKGHQAVVHPLPLAYAKIFDHPYDLHEVANPIIEHYQASRKFKNLV